MNFNNVKFVDSVHSLKQLPEPHYPEIAFAGRSNVGKSSLINQLIGRRNLVKTSARPGKTQGLNFFLVADNFYLVDLPGYGFARVDKQLQASWQRLITDYLRDRDILLCVVVIVDLRHEAKEQDLELIKWLRHQGKGFVVVYTKADKLSANEQLKNALVLDAAFGVQPTERFIFSAKSGLGCSSLQSMLASQIESCYRQARKE